MSAVTPEFSRVVRLDQTASAVAGETITANPDERAALAQRFQLIALDVLEADYALTGEAGAYLARGRLRATLAQACVATGEPVPEMIDTDFAIRFTHETPDPEADEMELDEDDCDTVFYEGEAIDIGEAVAETLALSMVPYPRSPDADAWLRERGVLSEEQASPFAALLALKGGKGRGGD